MTKGLTTLEWEIPEQMKPWLHVTLADRLDDGAGIRRDLRSRTAEESADMVRGIAHHARTLPHILTALGLPAVPPDEEFWQSRVLPVIRTETERRSRPKPKARAGRL